MDRADNTLLVIEPLELFDGPSVSVRYARVRPEI
jgi:hypothetical protein